MTGDTKARSATARHAAALVFCVSLLALGSWAALSSSPAPITAAFSLPWWVLIPVYAVTQHYPVDFENRRGTYSLHLTQLPLTFGIVLVAPAYHLLARLVGVALDCVVLRRQAPLKVCFNLGSAAIDVGIAATAVALIGHSDRPGPSLWVALLVSVIVTEVIGAVSLAGVWRLIGVPLQSRQMFEPLGFAVIASATFTGLAIVAVSAMYTDRASVAIIAVLGGALALAYRGHRRLFAQQRTTEKLYEFVKDLGPVSFDSDRLPPLLDEVRVLLHARHLDLAVPNDSDGWTHHLSSDDDTNTTAGADADELAEAVARAGAALKSSPGDFDRMSTPLIGARKLVGILTVTDRLGDIRRFDMGDMRLLETIATELTTSFERGKLLRDLERSATTDSLTGLANLSEVTRQINAALDDVDLLVAAVAVESFREVNDTLGHQVGDNLLLDVTGRLRRACPDAVIGRIGGGRFAVAVPAKSVGYDPEMFGLGIRAQVEGTTHLGGVGTHIRLSVGVVRAPEHGAEAATLLRRAETAMHSARNAHGGPVVWEPAYEVQGQRRLAVVSALREALSTGAIGVAFQPKVDSRNAAPVGVEALARWTHPALGAIGPDEFIPLAEASGLMGLLTSTVLRQALTACKGWQRRSPGVGVAVNVSATTLLDAAFVTQVAAILTASGVDPGLLTLELTEGVVMADPELASERMGELRALGVKISVDDFGTGYSSLTYLKGLPVDEVKIDRGFVNGLVREPADRAVVRAVVDIAHTLGIRVVAEGVENEAQRQVLHDLAVDELQGYLYARPMPSMEINQWLRHSERSVRH
ncbi:MAG: EAL domain-containing protein [Frankiaceae bacterium]|nr:EAL domain-containing protein [Frankiaceae bacterium]